MPHEATYAPDGDGFLVTCPHGCSLGTSAHQPTEERAAARVALHALATSLLPEARRAEQA